MPGISREDVQKGLEAFFADMNIPINSGVQKSIIDLDTHNFGELIPFEQVKEMINLARSQNQWLDAIDVQTVFGKKGTVPILDPYDALLQPVGENDPQGGLNTQPMHRKSYFTQKAQAVVYITYDDVREAMAAGISDYEDRLLNNFTIGLGNSLANIAYNGDKSLPATTPQSKMMRMVDGIRKQCLAGANVYNGQGAAFDPAIFYKIERTMPDMYSEQPNLMWMYNSLIDSRLREQLRNTATAGGSQGSALGDQVFVSGNRLAPLGKRPVIVPHISGKQGPTPLAPSSAATSGSGIEFVLTTLITAEYVADVASGVGRTFRVTHKGTGKSETVLGYQDTTLRIKTAGVLGQQAVSTIATDYEVTLADETDILYSNPKNNILVLNGDWRWEAYREPRFDRMTVVVHIDLDVLLAVPELMVFFHRIYVESPDWPATAA